MASFKISGFVIILILWIISWSAISAAVTAAQKWALDAFELDHKQWQSWMWVALISAILGAVILYALNLNLSDLVGSFIKRQ